ncbi:hypothetical protein HPG69_001637 [Diceros bicornis minor]|uniref:ADP-ribosyl cyclase/cyclic ADP-ribose hydrolase 1 n=1 Tax=Diceros bicornis minor TaxID=77932 RepID=A0A7J7FH29_DICBM|nr:hypothetical protein HPG69_001637 [Diceros bicornis minor]
MATSQSLSQAAGAPGRKRFFSTFCPPQVLDKDCQKIQEAFIKSFTSKDPCNVTEQDYQLFIELTNEIVPCDKTVFWSKTKELAHQYTEIQQEMFTLENTLLGYIVDGLRWCGDAGSSEINYKSCPDWREECFNNSVSVFWNAVSKRFAEDACGVVHVVLNGSLIKAFDEKSTFGRVEIRNLHPQKVHTLQAWVMHSIGGIASISCSSSSIFNLKTIINERNITFTCQDNYRRGTCMGAKCSMRTFAANEGATFLVN